MLRKLYDFNHLPENWNIKDYAPGSRSRDDEEWGGGRVRRLLYAAYTIAFLCLLRFDEVLKIQVHDIEIVSPTCIKLMLPFRKTDQNGGECGRHLCDLWNMTECGSPGIKPFFLHLLPEADAHLCPVRALADWVATSEIKEGYLFRKMFSGDRVAEANLPMVSKFHLFVVPFAAAHLFSLRRARHFWSTSGTISSTLALTHIHMGPIRFVVGAASTSLRASGGPFGTSANGQAGAPSSQT
jgi:hypothetical protein